LSLVFFTDRDLGKQFPAILEAAGLSVERHDAHFAPTASDEEWLQLVGARRWIAVSHDKRIRHKPNELAAVITHRVALLVVVGHVPFPELAHSFVATRARIERFVSRRTSPYIAKVYRASAAELAKNPVTPGRVELWYPGGSAREE
jgi:hypothetical protein